MLRHAWYVALPSHELRDAPRKATVHGIELVLFRGSAGDVVALTAHCPHRGCDLSLGTVTDGHLVCAFHGWRFDTSGECDHVPANPLGRTLPHRGTLRKYPALELGGLVWVYTGSAAPDAPAPTLLTFPEVHDPSYVRIPFVTSWHAHISRVMESTVDISHLPFVHPETTGSDVSPIVHGPEYHRSERGIVIHPSPFSPAHPMDPSPFDVETDERTEIEWWLPNHWIIRTPMGDEHWMATYLTFTPVDDENTVIHGLAMRNFDGDSTILDEFHVEYTRCVMAQDQAIVESIRPRITPCDMSLECHVPSDAPSLRLRQLLWRAVQAEVVVDS